MKKLILSVLCLAATILPGWCEVPPLPQAATSFGAAVSEGWLYMYGGNLGKAHEFHKECVRGEFFRVQLPNGKQWEKLPGGEGLLSPSLVPYQGTVIRIGGMNARNEKGKPNDLHSTDKVVQYDPKTGAWKDLPSLPQPRSSHDAAIIGDTLIVAGGWRLEGVGEGEWYNKALTLDLKHPEQGWKEHAQPFERRAIATVVLGKRVWFIGGMNSEDKPSRAVDWFEPETDKWGQGPEIPDGTMAGFGVAACVENNQLYISPLSGVVSVLNADANGWTEVTKLKQPRFFHRLLPVGDGRLVVVGGSTRKDQILEVEFLDVSPVVEKGVPASAPSAAAWPQWRGPNRDGISPATGWNKKWPEGGPAVLWRTQVGQGMSTPVVSEGKVILHGNDGEGTDTIFALNAATGQEVWRYAYPCAAKSHQMDIVPHGPAATPTIAGGLLFVLSREGDLLALQVADGKLVWRKHLIQDLQGKRPVYGYAQSPLVEGGKVYLDVGAAAGAQTSTVALEATTGKVVWQAGEGEAGYSSARLLQRDGKTYLAMFKGEGLQLIDPESGKTLWTYRTVVRDFANATTPVPVGHRLFVSNTGTEPATLLDWDVATEPNVRRTWEYKQLSMLFNSPILHEGSLFGFNEKRRGHHEFTCLDIETGASRWVTEVVPTSTFILADNHWIFFTRDGEVVLAPASKDECKPIARFKAVGGKCYATPVLAEQKLFVRNNAGEVVTFNLQAAAE